MPRGGCDGYFMVIVTSLKRKIAHTALSAAILVGLLIFRRFAVRSRLNAG